MRTRLTWVVVGLLALCWPAAGAVQPPRTRHIVIVSIDGLRPAHYLPGDTRRPSTPTLDALRARGSWAEAVVGQYPSLTYPSHTSIATGTVPARHGVTQNTWFDPAAGSNAWIFDNSALAVPALWDVARGAGLTTAAVSWPVTVGARIDYLLPETNQAPRESTWLDLARRQSTPGLVDAVVERLGGFGPNDNRDYNQRDRFAAAAAALIFEKHRPNLMMLHLVEADTAQHQFGPDSPETAAAITRVDGRVGEVVRAVEAAGLTAQTVFIITGDHGFYRIHSAFQPNAALQDAGLLEVDGSGRITTWQAAAHRAGIRLKDSSDEALARQVEQLFDGLAAGQFKGLFRVLKRDEIAKLGGDPAILLFIEPVEGYTTAAGVAGGFLVSSPRRGDHGYLPDSPAMHTGLIIAGPGVASGLAIPIARQIDIAPTAARLLGLELPAADGVAMAGVLVRNQVSR